MMIAYAEDMVSTPRNMIIDDQSIFHVTWKCHNDSWFLQHPWAKQLYYDLLLKYKDRYHIHIYSYCFMDNHPHLTGYCESVVEFSNFFRTVNSLFARKFNKKNDRKGQVIMDRFKSPKIETFPDLEKVMFYIDLNPSRANMVAHPKDYQWTSYHHYALGREDPLITQAPSYKDMGRTTEERQRTYITMVEDILKADWKMKKEYSSIPFIGNPDWVAKKYQELREIRRQKHLEWRARFEARFLKPKLVHGG